MRRLIAELCVADHRNDSAVLTSWLSNKTTEIFRSWIRPDNSLLVAIGVAIRCRRSSVSANDTARFRTAHFPSVALTPSHTAPTKPVAITVITALNV